MTIIDIDSKCSCIDGVVFQLENARNTGILAIPELSIPDFKAWIIPESVLPIYGGLKSYDYCLSGISLSSGGPFNLCTSNKLTIQKTSTFFPVYYGPTFYCSSSGDFKLGFMFQSKKVRLNNGTCFEPVFFGNDISFLDNVADLSNDCSSPFYKEFTVSNQFNQFHADDTASPDQWFNLFNCSGSGNFKVTITE
jgi:hypothetical protein